jgi:hypothetical protein
VKTQWLSQCQAFQHLVRSSHTLVNWTFDLLNRFSISLACFWKHWMLFASVCNINTPGQWKESLDQTSQSLCSSFWSHKCDFGAEPRSRIIATSAVKGLIRTVTQLKPNLKYSVTHKTHTDSFTIYVTDTTGMIVFSAHWANIKEQKWARVLKTRSPLSTHNDIQVQVQFYLLQT